MFANISRRSMQKDNGFNFYCNRSIHSFHMICCRPDKDKIVLFIQDL